MKTIIVHHANCPDGFGAAWWLRRQLVKRGYEAVGSTIELVAANWGDAPDIGLMTDAGVYVVDFCYEAEHLDAIADVSTWMSVLDHHQTSEQYAAASMLPVFGSIDEWANASTPGKVGAAIVIDKSRSGVGLVMDAAERFWRVEPLEFLLDLEDRDLWRFERPNTRDTFAAVTSHPYTIEAWDTIAAEGYLQLVQHGIEINRYRDQLIDQCAQSTMTLYLDLPDPSEYRIAIPIANAPYSVSSDVAERVMRNAGTLTGGYFIVHATDVQIGLRSEPSGPDVAKIAEQYGGGGHPRASGLRLSHARFVDWVSDPASS